MQPRLNSKLQRRYVNNTNTSYNDQQNNDNAQAWGGEPQMSKNLSNYPKKNQRLQRKNQKSRNSQDLQSTWMTRYQWKRSVLFKIWRHSYTTDYHKAPKSYENFIGDEQTSASARFVIPTSYRILKKSSDYKKSSVPLSLIFRPLADLNEEEQEVPTVDYSSFPMLRCQRCGTFLNPHFNFEGSEFQCNICLMKNGYVGERGNPQEPWDQTNAVYDLIVPKEFHVKPLVQPNILFCVELTKKTVESGISFFY